MRKIVLSMITVALAANLVGPAAAATRARCAIAPGDYEVVASTLDTSSRIARLDYSVMGTTMLDCPDDHPWDGATMGIAERAVVRLGDTEHQDTCFQDSDVELSTVGEVRGRARDHLEIGNDAATFDGNVSGTIGSRGNNQAGCATTWTVEAVGPNGSKLTLEETGVIAVTGTLDGSSHLQSMHFSGEDLWVVY